MPDRKTVPPNMVPRAPTNPPARKSNPDLSAYGNLTYQDLNTILEVNQKALTIYLEVEKQNEEIIEVLSDTKEELEILKNIDEKTKELATAQESVIRIAEENKKLIEEIKKKSEEIDKNFFRLILLLGTGAAGTILNLVQAYLQHK